MKTIGLLGGMSWESTLNYYKWINEGIRKHLGGLHSAKIILNSLDFQEIEQLQMTERWDLTGKILAKEASAIEKAGADFLLLCTNTMHKNADAIEAAINIPFLHIADATAEKLKSEGITRVGLLGTRFTMEEDFYKGRLENTHGIEVVVPDMQDMDLIHGVIYNELCMGNIQDNSRKRYLDVIEKMKSERIQGMILGCTEISMLIQEQHTDIALFDTTAIHTEAAVQFALLE